MSSNTTIPYILRYAEDISNAVDCLVAHNMKKVFLVTIMNDAIDFQDNTKNKAAIQTRLIIADGYRSTAPGDGYLNPGVHQVKSNINVLSAGQLVDNTILVGPFCFPYERNNQWFGIDPIIFQPWLSNNNLQVYLLIFGEGLAKNGDFFKITEIVISGKGMGDNISYKVKAEATNTRPQL
jgi:hypothetical protein